MARKKKAQSDTILDFKLNSRFFFYTAVVVIIFLGVFLRMLPYSNVITDNTVQLKGADAYFFTRQAEDIRNGGLPQTDPLLCYPQGFQYDRGAALYPLMLAGMGSVMPLDMATAVASPLLALVFMLLMFFLLRELLPDNDWAVLAGLAVASLTGIQFISRSYFGFGDRHVLENVLFLGGILCLIKSWNKASWKWGIAAAVTFCLYSFAWSESSMMLAILMIGVACKYIFTEATDWGFTWRNVLIFGAPLFVGMIFGNIQVIGVAVISAAACIGLQLLALRFKEKLPRLGMAVVFTVAAVILLYFLFPVFYSKIVSIISGYLGNSSGPTVSEAQPMFSIYSNISLLPPNSVTIQLILFVMAILGFFALYRKKHYTLLVLGMILAILSIMRIRTEYYFVISAAIGVAFLATETKKFAYIALALSGIFLLLYGSAWMQDLNNNVSSLAFSSADYQMAEWMRTNLPDAGVALAGNYASGDQANYGVLADWQLGYLYTFIAKKPLLAEPNFCNFNIPTQFLMQTDEQQAYMMLKSRGIKYVLAKKIDLNKYYYYLTQTNQADQFAAVSGTVSGTKYTFIDQSFFERIGIRLFNFNGEAYTPTNVYAIDKTTKSLNQFDSFDKAVAAGAGSYYSTDYNQSPVPLGALQHFKLVQSFNDSTGGVKLFEVVD